MQREVDHDAEGVMFGAALFVLLLLAVFAHQLATTGNICGKSGDGPVTCWYLYGESWCATKGDAR